jgi:hypothetical protein
MCQYVHDIWLITILYQTIIVNSSQPCFLNYSNPSAIMQNCGMGHDYLRATLIGWQWVTGGNISMIFAALLVMFSYIAYHKVVYPILIGTVMLPISFFLFPETFIVWGFVMTAVAIGILVWYVLISQTNEQ